MAAPLLPPPNRRPSHPGEQRAAPLNRPTAADRLTAAVRRAFDAADAGLSRCTPAALAAEGMSGAATRHFLNALLCAVAAAAAGSGSSGRCACLQIGVWRGSSVFAALAGSAPGCLVTAVDDWSEFGGPRAAFEAAAAEVLAPEERERLTVIDGDAFALDPPLPDNAFDVYLYDGAHDYESQVYAITAMWRHLAPAAVIIVDDWNFEEVRQGTADGIAAVTASGAGCVAASFERRLTPDGSHTPLPEAERGFWNGLGVFVIEKTTDQGASPLD